MFVFYHAGHGVMSVGDEDPEFYLAPHEITPLYGERRVLRRLAIPGRDLLAATEFAKPGHGAFTHVRLDGLGGASDGVFMVNELNAYLEAKVPELTAAEKGASQYPVAYGYGQDFPVSVAGK